MIAISGGTRGRSGCFIAFANNLARSDVIRRCSVPFFLSSGLRSFCGSSISTLGWNRRRRRCAGSSTVADTRPLYVRLSALPESQVHTQYLSAARPALAGLPLTPSYPIGSTVLNGTHPLSQNGSVTSLSNGRLSSSLHNSSYHLNQHTSALNESDSWPQLPPAASNSDLMLSNPSFDSADGSFPSTHHSSNGNGHSPSIVSPPTATTTATTASEVSESNSTQRAPGGANGFSNKSLSSATGLYPSSIQQSLNGNGSGPSTTSPSHSNGSSLYTDGQQSPLPPAHSNGSFSLPSNSAHELSPSTPNPSPHNNSPLQPPAPLFHTNGPTPRRPASAPPKPISSPFALQTPIPLNTSPHNHPRRPSSPSYLHTPTHLDASTSPQQHRTSSTSSIAHTHITGTPGANTPAAAPPPPHHSHNTGSSAPYAPHTTIKYSPVNVPPFRDNSMMPPSSPSRVRNRGVHTSGMSPEGAFSRPPPSHSRARPSETSRSSTPKVAGPYPPLERAFTTSPSNRRNGSTTPVVNPPPSLPSTTTTSSTSNTARRHGSSLSSVNPQTAPSYVPPTRSPIRRNGTTSFAPVSPPYMPSSNNNSSPTPSPARRSSSTMSSLSSQLNPPPPPTSFLKSGTSSPSPSLQRSRSTSLDRSPPCTETTSAPSEPSLARQNNGPSSLSTQQVSPPRPSINSNSDPSRGNNGLSTPLSPPESLKNQPRGNRSSSFVGLHSSPKSYSFSNAISPPLNKQSRSHKSTSSRSATTIKRTPTVVGTSDEPWTTDHDTLLIGGVPWEEVAQEARKSQPIKKKEEDDMGGPVRVPRWRNFGADPLQELTEEKNGPFPPVPPPPVRKSRWASRQQQTPLSPSPLDKRKEKEEQKANIPTTKTASALQTVATSSSTPVPVQQKQNDAIQSQSRWSTRQQTPPPSTEMKVQRKTAVPAVVRPAAGKAPLGRKPQYTQVPGMIMEGIVDHVVYHLKDSGYAVIKFKCILGDKAMVPSRITGREGKHPYVDGIPLASDSEGCGYESTVITAQLVGAEVLEGQSLRVAGYWKEHAKYGNQFHCVHAQEVRPTSVEAVQKYLGSGVIRGFGPRMAKRIVDRFGLQTMEIMEKHPERVMKEVSGVGSKRLGQISEAWKQRAAMRDLMQFCVVHGVNTAYAAKIFKVYSSSQDKVENIVLAIQANPYRLASDIPGIGFHMADRIARLMSMDRYPALPVRHMAGVMHVLLAAAEDDGHCFLPMEETMKRAREVLALKDQPMVTDEELCAAVHDMVEGKQLIVVDTEYFGTSSADANEPSPSPSPSAPSLKGPQRRVIHAQPVPNVPKAWSSLVCYLPSYHTAELEVAERLSRMAHLIPNNHHAMDSWMNTYTKRRKIKLSKEQEAAVRMANSFSVSVLTGGPGCGKTFTTGVIVDYFKSQGKKVALVAPTGRAAQRLAELSGSDAQTIHRLVNFQTDGRKFGMDGNKERVLQYDVVIVDECSMMDVFLTHALLKAIRTTAQVIFVGDSDQLPSVGPGRIFGEMIESNVVQVTRLTEIFRQAKTSSIISNAHSVNNGIFPEWTRISPLIDALSPPPPPPPTNLRHRTSSPVMTLAPPSPSSSDPIAIDPVFDVPLSSYSQPSFASAVSTSSSSSSSSSIQNRSTVPQTSTSALAPSRTTIQTHSSIVPSPEQALKGFHFATDSLWAKTESVADTLRALTQVVQKVLPHLRFDPMTHLQVLTPCNNGQLGVGILNNLLQQLLNPAHQSKAEYRRGPPLQTPSSPASPSPTNASANPNDVSSAAHTPASLLSPPNPNVTTFRVGDRVMHTVNNYEKEVFNGEVGIIQKIDQEARKLIVRYSIISKEDLPTVGGQAAAASTPTPAPTPTPASRFRDVEYDFSDLDELSLAWAITIHKSQGSEYPVVIVVGHHAHHRNMLTRNLFYTALTRSQRLFVFVGSTHAIQNAVERKSANERHSLLRDRLKVLSKPFASPRQDGRLLNLPNRSVPPPPPSSMTRLASLETRHAKNRPYSEAPLILSIPSQASRGPSPPR